MPRIHVHIDRLVLQGAEPLQAPHITEALRTGLRVGLLGTDALASKLHSSARLQLQSEGQTDARNAFSLGQAIATHMVAKEQSS